MKIESVVARTIARVHPDLGRLRAAAQDRKPKEIVPPDKIARRFRFAAAAGVPPTRMDLERILGDNDLLNLNYLERGLRAARPVGRIIFVGPGGQPRGYATGFMISPRLLLTNHHVFPQAADAAGAWLEMDYEVDLSGRPRPTERFRFRPQDFFFASSELDFAVVAVDPEPQLGNRALANFGWLQVNPALGKINEGEYVSIIQHPGGEPKQISIRENQLIRIEGPYLVYLCDTAPGSSGSPVFNDSWQVVGLHHSGVPARDRKGRWLGPDGRPAPENAAENQIKWVANEGIRASVVVECLEEKAARGAHLDEFVACARQTGEAARDSRGADAQVVAGPGSPVSAAVQAGFQVTPVGGVSADGTVTVLIPVSFRIASMAGLVPGTGLVSGTAPTSLPTAGSNGNGTTGADRLDEVKVLDPDYSRREGYQPGFLGVTVPLPTLTSTAMKTVARMLGRTDKLSHVIPYHHFSVVMNSERRLSYFAASNYDHSAAFRGNLSRKQLGADKWDPDPRVDPRHQIKKDEIYDATDFDLGHLVMRENNYWGRNEQEAVFANWDTFHYTNCTPQHFAFNQESRKGLWGLLESHIADQMSEQGGRLSIFAGPVFSRTDKVFRGVMIPKQYWKVVVARTSARRLAAWGFLLSQEQLIKDMEADFEPGPFQTYQVSLAAIEKKTQVRFPSVVKQADVKAAARPTETLALTESTLPMVTGGLQ